MELYEIAEFLEFPRLMQECEDVIFDNLNVSSLLGVLEWSTQPSGSKYVYRQALNFFSDEFCSLCKASVFLANLPHRFLLEIIKNDFVNASEEFILATVIKWGEWKIARANEKPGSSPANSFPRRSPKRKDINNTALLEIISDLLPFVRLRHILPTNSTVLQFAYQRGLLQRPFPFDMVASEKRPPVMVYWIREFRHSEYMRPRLFMNFYYEAKLVLHEQLSSENDSGSCVSSNTTLPYQLCMPDMLPISRQIHRTSTSTTESDNTPTISLLNIMQLNCHLMKKVILREKELKTSTLALQAFSLSPDNIEISRYIQLQVIREFGLPDEISDEIFQQKPDLIEDSDSATSSKHSTLNKVGYLLREDSLLNSPQADIIVDVINASISTNSYQSNLESNFTNQSNGESIFIKNNFSQKKNSLDSFDDSPLDLPLSLGEQPLLEQDLLANISDN